MTRIARPLWGDHLMVFGPGYTGMAAIRWAQRAAMRVSATWRREETRDELARDGIAPIPFDAVQASDMRSVTHLLMSVAPRTGDPVLSRYMGLLHRAPRLKWIGYLSSTNVYGDHGGAWVDETTPPAPALARGQRRLAAEREWARLAGGAGVRLHIFRLAGIYGPGRNALRSVLDGRARRIIKPGQVFSRIHVADIAGVVGAAMASAAGSQVFNLADGHPAPPQDVITHAAALLGIEPPAKESFETAQMSEMARSFYSESKKVRANRVRDILGYPLKYNNYHAGLAALLPVEQARD